MASLRGPGWGVGSTCRYYWCSKIKSSKNQGAGRDVLPLFGFSDASGFSHALVLGLVNQFVFGNPGHHAAQLGTNLLNRMCGIQATACCHFRIVGAAFEDEFLGVFTVLD